MKRYLYQIDCHPDLPTARGKVAQATQLLLFARKMSGVFLFLCVLLSVPIHLLAGQPIDSRQHAPAQNYGHAADLFGQQNTSTAQPAAEGAIITVTVKARPTSRQDFRFYGDLGDFRLDHAAPDDGDTISQTRTFTVTPGVYTITQETPQTWQMSAISCSPRALAQIDLRIGKAILTVQAGDRLHCTFVNERGVIVRTRSYHDRNGSRSLSLGESYLTAWSMTLYREVNIVAGVQLTNHYGKANFNYLPPGEYTICQTALDGWANSQPGVVDPTYGAPCYTFTLHPGELATLWFGNQQAGDPAPEQPPTLPRAITIVQSADVATDASGYDGWTFVDSDMNQDDRGPTIFLPLTFVS